ncbi:uncharacterized protein F4807DRAFT_432137 [Annulohypoxylon truncatum]|uniref:uncharacterized protein n=1 Tax=Annulohypoxylon truncatum TaxID=327061 RepID=UPI002007EE94|nr:uncharacterized protein F4807DRAFT_432137 [Annulohypoxylon truncatum]KAI1208242.1 hypothetical protein F4807DRAFT_432137 [Annulohypoxylon truncatum]
MWKRFRSRKQAGSEDPSVSGSSSTSAIYRPTHPLPEPTLSLPERPLVQRDESDRSAAPDVQARLFSSQTSIGYRGQDSQDRRNDPFGLLVLHAPAQRSVDILFIHGLGGTSLRTWCYNRELEYLWPKLWLPEEPDLSAARILTFGYNAHFSSKKEKVSLTIGDFANDLLFRMKYGERGPERLGQVPIIVVAHSMGGLVFKKAFIHGHLNEEFHGIISSIKAVLFLATPHRGTDLAKTLNKILTSSVFGHSPKDYVSELARKSPTIDELNDSFRHLASKLKIFSFYETLNTDVGPMSFMIVEKYSSVLGYPDETPHPLIANHHDVCKFKSTDDPNYVSVVGALRSVIATARISKETSSSAEEDLAQVTTLLGISAPPEDDIAACRAVRKAGTCEQFLETKEFNDWKGGRSSPVLWVYAPPGNGKSTMCSAVVDDLLEQGQHCAYFFFKHESRQKRSVSNMLRSLAYQSALIVPSYCHALADLAKSGLRLHALDTVTLWKKLYLQVLSSLRHEVIYWILDGIDESESVEQLVDLIPMVSGSEPLIRVLVFSRPLPAISRSFQRIGEIVSVDTMALPSNEGDIRLYVTDRIEHLPSNDNFRAEIISEIIRRSQGSFLWASLVLNRIVRCHRQGQVKRVLSETPDGMDELYDRMLSTVENLEFQEDKILARILFAWAMYAKTPLTVDELSEPYSDEFGSIMDLKHTISQICGQFVTVDTHNRVSLVHDSARQYLQESSPHSFSLDRQTAHEDLLCKCLDILCDSGLQGKINTLRVPKFLPYAATSWAFHLENCLPKSDRVFDALVKFFSSTSPLPWIQYLSMSNHLAELIAVSRSITSFSHRRKKIDAGGIQVLNLQSDLSLIDSWAIDLSRLPARFGRYLLEDPQLIHTCIPALSPTSSVIYQRFSESPTATLSISSPSNSEWNDCLARVSANAGRALRLAVTASYLAVATDKPMGRITLWDTTLFQSFGALDAGEYIDSLAFNNSGSLLACCGISRTCIWKTETCSLTLNVRNPSRQRALELRFTETDSLMVVTDLGRIYSLSSSEDMNGSADWVQLNPALMQETNFPEGMFLGTPSSVSFNNDCTQIAVWYRAFPLSIWNIDPPKMVARLKLKTNQGQMMVRSHTGTTKVVWHPSGAQLIGIHGEVFRWSPVNNTYKAVKERAGVVPDEIQCNPNGLVFITSDVEGTIKIYDVETMIIIYKLTSENMINKVCFSPSGFRFYDLRGSYCNIWEPNCLLQLADADGLGERFWYDADNMDSASISIPAIESQVNSRATITVMATCNRADQHVAYINIDGVVELYHPISSSRHVIEQAIVGIDLDVLAWNQSHDQLALVLLNGAVMIKEISTDDAGHGQPSVKNVYSEKGSQLEGRGHVKQLLFDTTGKLLLVHGASKSQVLSLPNGEVTAERDTSEALPAHWMQHPSRPDALISVSISHVSIFSWNLQEERSVALEIPLHPSGPLTIDLICQNYYSRLLLLRTSSFHLRGPNYGFIVLSTSTYLSIQGGLGTQTPISPIDISKSIVEAVLFPLGILPDGRLVFLDNNFWVCTAHISDKTDIMTRHFFMPHDWVTDSGLRLCQLLQDGTILCPRNGGVAIIQNNMVAEW